MSDRADISRKERLLAYRDNQNAGYMTAGFHPLLWQMTDVALVARELRQSTLSYTQTMIQSSALGLGHDPNEAQSLKNTVPEPQGREQGTGWLGDSLEEMAQGVVDDAVTELIPRTPLTPDDRVWLRRTLNRAEEISARSQNGVPEAMFQAGRRCTAQ